MRFESVTAHAFGPFVGERLELGPGLNVIWGPNESGKSTWHAALYFGLCGRRRGSGQPGPEARLLRARHEPWDRAGWDVEVEVALADGRRIGLRHDLAQLVACRAIDLDLGRDCSSEILVGNDAPDGARWLGLDRRTFSAIACVRQADLLAVRDNPALLREHVQRAAATGGADATAARALDCLDQFRRSGVGATHATAVGPLKRALDGVSDARLALDHARAAHAEALLIAARADALDAEAGAAHAQLLVSRARVARQEAATWRRRFDRAHELDRLLATETGRNAEGDGTERAIGDLDTRPDPALQARVEDARQGVEVASARRPLGRTLIGASLLAGLGISVAIGLGVATGVAFPLVGMLLVALLVLALLLAAWGRRRTGDVGLVAAHEALRRAEQALADDRAARLETRLEARDGLPRLAAELRGLLDGATLADLEQEARRRQQVAELLAAQTARAAPSDFDPSATVAAWSARSAAGPSVTETEESARADANSPAEVDRLEARAREALAAATRTRGEADERARVVQSVPESEEALATAEAEMDRVRTLARTLDLTRQFLETDEQRVHRDLAPVLNRAVERWLPIVTNGRYARALVDPETLAVKVAGPSGDWRDAALVSHGTAEQVYLLLRIALADCLTRRGEVCPLVLDDVTAQFDARRTRAVLGTLHALSNERQVILFSQEDDVRSWADENLRAASDRIVRLPGPTGPA